jgi:hypothetical protein
MPFFEVEIFAGLEGLNWTLFGGRERIGSRKILAMHDALLSIDLTGADQPKGSRSKGRAVGKIKV